MTDRTDPPREGFLRRLPPNVLMGGVLLGAVLLFGAVFGMKAMIARGTNAHFDNMAQPAIAVTAASAKGERWRDSGEAVGTFVAVNGTDVTAEAGGVIREILFQPGQRVKAGTVLVRLNTANEEATLRALEASAKLAAQQRDRWLELGKQKLVSQVEVEERATQAATSLAQVEAQRAVIALKTVRAPFDGVLGIRKINLGQYVSPGDPLVNLQALDPILLDFTLPQQKLAQVAEGSVVRATLDGMPGTAFDGTIVAIEPQIDPQTRNFKVQARFVNEDLALRPGMFARITFGLGTDRSVVVIPQTAITFNPYGNAVFVIEEVKRAPDEMAAHGQPATGGKLVVRQRFVKTGTTRGDLISVTEGLKPGERVVTSGLLKLRNDAEVTINNKVQPAADAAPRPGNS